MKQAKILIVKTGDTFADLISSYGDFEDWIRRGLGVGEDQVRVVNAPAFEPLPGPGTFNGTVIAGSHAMVTQNLDWSLEVEEWLAPVVMALGKDPDRLQKQVTDTPEAGQVLVRFAGVCNHDHIAPSYH